MKVSAIAIALCVWISNAPQTGSFEKQAISSVQRMLASNLDDELPDRPFATWFTQSIGPDAGVIWQLTECGERIGSSGAEQDLPACAEANAVLPDGRKVIVVITVGTFKKGLSGKPAFFRAVVERNDQLYQIGRLRDLPWMLRGPGGKPVRLPVITQVQPLVKLQLHPVSLLRASLSFSAAPGNSNEVDESLPLVIPPQATRRVSEGVLRGNAISKFKPFYPNSARMINAFGPVEVQVTISEVGRVIEAKAISGHTALRIAAVEAARKWVFKPTILNGMAIKVESILTFIFTPGAQ